MKTVAELQQELREAEIREAKEKEERLRKHPVEYRYTISPDRRSSGLFDKVYDPTCRRYVLKREVMNEADARIAGHPDHKLSRGSMVYLYNKLTHRIIASVGGGVSYIGPPSRVIDKHPDYADDEAFRRIGEFLAQRPSGGDVTEIVDEYLAARSNHE